MQVLVGEPSVADTVQILRGLKERYAGHHGVQISDRALVAAAQLSDRYITNRFLPDKAIDLMDEAAANLQVRTLLLPVAAVLVAGRQGAPSARGAAGGRCPVCETHACSPHATSIAPAPPAAAPCCCRSSWRASLRRSTCWSASSCGCRSRPRRWRRRRTRRARRAWRRCGASWASWPTSSSRCRCATGGRRRGGGGARGCSGCWCRGCRCKCKVQGVRRSPHSLLPSSSAACRQEKELLDGIKELTKRKEQLAIRLEQAENRMDLAMVADLRYGAMAEVSEESLHRVHWGHCTAALTCTAWAKAPRCRAAKPPPLPRRHTTGGGGAAAAAGRGARQRR